MAALTAPGSQAILAVQINASLDSNMAWLKTATTVLGDPSSPYLSQLAGLGVDAQTKFDALGSKLPAAAGMAFPSSTPIIAYASSAAASAQAAATQAAAAAQAAATQAAADAATTAGNVQFADHVMGLLNQSIQSFQTVNSFYAQLEAVTHDGYANFTLAQAEQQIATIVANRTSLAAAAQALNAPTPAAAVVSNDLAAAFSASLTDDTDLDNCLNQANNGTEAYIFQGCLNASTTDSSAATSTKQTFLSAYNQLLASINQPAVNMQF